MNYQEILEMLKSEEVIKYSIYFVFLSMYSLRVKDAAKEVGYKRKKTKISERITSLMFWLIILVPYIGWGLVILNIFSIFLSDKNLKESVMKSSNYEKL